MAVCGGRIIAKNVQDSWASVKQHIEMALLIKHAEWVVIENCGHMTLLEHPQQLSDLLPGWMEE
jgi:pimeloyl-ACP methyl ester carboxylesterase